jgi:very-short-patch-repair endonuclease
LAIELDGGQHNMPEGRGYDVARTNYLNAHGVEVVRFWNNEVLGNIAGVLACLELKANT